MFNLTKSNKKCTCNEQHPRDGGAAAAGAAEGPGTNPPGSGVRAGASGAAAVTGPAPRKQGDIGEKGAAASLRARPRARQTRAVRTGIAKAQSRLPADLSARLPPLLRNLQQRVAHMFLRS